MNILLLEDHLDTALWMQEVVHEAFTDACIVHVPRIMGAKQALKRLKFSLAILDIHLPDGNGIDLIRLVKCHNAETTVVMSTIFDDDRHLFDALKAGADGYLLKEQTREDLVQRLRGILCGEPPLSPGIARRLITHFNGASAHLAKTFTQKNVALSPREQQTLTLLAKGYSIKELARLLTISDSTAAGYVKNIYRKLNISCRAEATMEASRMGLVSF